jgi:nitrate/nitrite transport system substrate-binding protein
MSPLSRYHCTCGKNHATGSVEECSNVFVERTFERALFPHAAQRRALIKAVGLTTLRAAIASVIPVGAAQAFALDARGPLEKKELNIGFVPIICATPLLMAGPLGVFSQQGLKVNLIKTGSWGGIEQAVRSGALDASHFLSPMPLAMTLGLGDKPAIDVTVATIQNTNGQAITLAKRHADKRDPAKWKGMRFGVPSEFSMHNFLLRYYVAEHGIDPNRDIKIVVTPPPQMVAALKAGDIDGFLSPDPFNQRAVYDGVGFIHLLTKEIWDGHPCCAFGATNKWIEAHPNTFASLYRAVINASVLVGVSVDRASIAKTIAAPEFLNQPVEIVDQVLTGKYPDGLGGTRQAYDRVQFDPIPWPSMAAWMLSQMHRWGYLKTKVNYTQLAEKVFDIVDAKAQMSAAGWGAPRGDSRKIVVMGKLFNPAQAEAYANSFAIHA